MSKNILTINGGSSSIRFALFEIGGTFRRLLEGKMERIGQPDATLRVDDSTQKVNAPDFPSAVNAFMDWMQTHVNNSKFDAVGHRIVHGGPTYSSPEKITPAVIQELHRMESFDPQHLPGEMALVEAIQQRFPKLPQVACFDTAFHHDLPAVAKTLAIPRSYLAKGVRRYGFHGLSYSFLMEELARVAGAEAAQGRIVMAHLGNGASLAAVHGGKPIDTSMSFTPTAGIPMSTRAGDLDPSLMFYFARTEKMSPEQFNDMIQFKSGLLGISETSSDMRDLFQREATDPRAREAIDLFCYQTKKFIGAFAAAMGGLDTLIFAGGIGENIPAVRSRVCTGLQFLGIEINEEENARNGERLSITGAKVEVRVMRTDEESMIAKMTSRVLNL